MNAHTVLLVLPKWTGKESGSHRGWIASAELLPPFFARVAAQVGNVEVVRVPRVTSWSRNEIGRVPVISQGGVQLIKSSRLRPVIGNDSGMLVGELRSGARRLWILADPDPLQNHGLADPDNAVFAVALINALRGSGRQRGVRRGHPRVRGQGRLAVPPPVRVSVRAGDRPGRDRGGAAAVGDHAPVRRAAVAAGRAAVRQAQPDRGDRQPARFRRATGRSSSSATCTRSCRTWRGSCTRRPACRDGADRVAGPHRPRRATRRSTAARWCAGPTSWSPAAAARSRRWRRSRAIFFDGSGR